MASSCPEESREDSASPSRSSPTTQGRRGPRRTSPAGDHPRDSSAGRTTPSWRTLRACRPWSEIAAKRGLTPGRARVWQARRQRSISLTRSIPRLQPLLSMPTATRRVCRRASPSASCPKEFVRQWLIEHGFMNEPGQTLPELTDAYAERERAHRKLQASRAKFDEAAEEGMHARASKRNVSQFRLRKVSSPRRSSSMYEQEKNQSTECRWSRCLSLPHLTTVEPPPVVEHRQVLAAQGDRQVAPLPSQAHPRRGYGHGRDFRHRGSLCVAPAQGTAGHGHLGG